MNVLNKFFKKSYKENDDSLQLFIGWKEFSDLGIALNLRELESANPSTPMQILFARLLSEEARPAETIVEEAIMLLRDIKAWWMDEHADERWQTIAIAQAILERILQIISAEYKNAVKAKEKAHKEMEGRIKKGATSSISRADMIALHQKCTEHDTNAEALKHMFSSIHSVLVPLGFTAFTHECVHSTYFCLDIIVSDIYKMQRLG